MICMFTPESPVVVHERVIGWPEVVFAADAANVFTGVVTCPAKTAAGKTRNTSDNSDRSFINV